MIKVNDSRISLSLKSQLKMSLLFIDMDNESIYCQNTVTPLWIKDDICFCEHISNIHCLLNLLLDDDRANPNVRGSGN